MCRIVVKDETGTVNPQDLLTLDSLLYTRLTT